MLKLKRLWWWLLSAITRGRAALSANELTASLYVMKHEMEAQDKRLEEERRLVERLRCDLRVATRENELLTTLIEESRSRIEAVTADHARHIKAQLQSENTG